MQRSDPEDFQIRWQTFLIDGFEDWRAAATVASTQLVNTTARDVLQGMISAFYFANGAKQSVDHIARQLEMFAFAANATVRDKKTGKILGTMQGLKRKNQQTPVPKAENPDPVRARRKLRQTGKPLNGHKPEGGP